ncbi:hypothetical protein ACJIZ3_006906 [Penstemon smallii]|uniref:Uncharacterized protein n=1 Tax=Penstemon smallii TaxID=265156 RepID=A0ABD3S904_9LAMI
MVEAEGSGTGTSEHQEEAKNNMKVELGEQSAGGKEVEESAPSTSISTQRWMKGELSKFMDEMAKLPTPITSPDIYKVPKEFRTGKNEKCFDPVSIPIGPLHHDPNSPSQKLKQSILKNFIYRVNKDIDGLADLMSGLEKRIRDCYRDIDPGLDGFKLLKIMLLDGSFIVELLLSQDMSENYTTDAVVGNTEKVPFYTLKQDLLKIENQIPFLVLITLVDFAARSRQPPASKSTNQEISNQPQPELIDLALHYFNITKPEKFSEQPKPEQPKHLLDLFMKTVFYNNTTDSTTVVLDERAVSAVNEKLLKEAKTASEMEGYGVKFEAVESDILTKIDFSNGILKIPKIFIEESTPDLYWNFLVYEMSSSKRVFASYIVLMDTLINNEKDVQILLGAKILVSRINDTKWLVSLFNDLSATVKPKDFHFAPILRKVNLYCESNIPRVRGYFVRNYYDARWDLLNNSLLFFFTVTQTIFSVLSYNPKSNTK